MTDLHARRGAFKGISAEDAGELCRAAVQVINDLASLVVAVSCDANEVTRLLPSDATVVGEPMLDSARSPYNCGLHWSMGAMGDLVSEPQGIAYWFEQGDEFQGAAKRFLANLHDPRTKPLREWYRYGSDVFVPKADAHLFDTADLVAWEWGKHIDRVREGKGARPSLAALMGGPCIVSGQPFWRSDSRYASHYTGWPLERFFGKMKRIVSATTPEQIDEAVQASWA